jgi:hypothetical protein
MGTGNVRYFCAGLRILIRGPGSGGFKALNPDPRYRIRDPIHISDSLFTILWATDSNLFCTHSKN